MDEQDRKDRDILVRLLEKAIDDNRAYVAYMATTEIARTLPEIHLAELWRANNENESYKRSIIRLKSF